MFNEAVYSVDLKYFCAVHQLNVLFEKCPNLQASPTYSLHVCNMTTQQDDVHVVAAQKVGCTAGVWVLMK